jgi:hypothetical protein
MVDESIYIKKTSLCMLDYDLLPYMVVLILPMKNIEPLSKQFQTDHFIQEWIVNFFVSSVS